MKNSDYKYWNIRSKTSFYSGGTQMRIDIMKKVLPDIIYRDFLSNIHFINKLYLFLEICSPNLLDEIQPRLFHSDQIAMNEPDDLAVATIWFSFGEELREQINYFNQEELFWNIFVESQDVYKVMDSSKEDMNTHEIKEPKVENVDKEKNEFVITLNEDKDNNIIIFKDAFLEKLALKMERVYEASKADQILEKIDYVIQNIKGFREFNFNKEYLTLEETAAYLGLTKQTIYNYNYKNILGHYTLDGKKKYYKKEEIIKLLESNKVISKEEATRKANKLLSK